MIELPPQRIRVDFGCVFAATPHKNRKRDTDAKGSIVMGAKVPSTGAKFHLFELQLHSELRRSEQRRGAHIPHATILALPLVRLR
jgi:hypothetical protein